MVGRMWSQESDAVVHIWAPDFGQVINLSVPYFPDK